MLSIYRFWYLQSAQHFYQSWLSTYRLVEGRLAVGDTLRNLSKPLFQDYTLQGRAIGILFRIARSTLGAFVHLVMAGLYLGVYVFWLLFPLICIVNILGAFFGPSSLSVANAL